MFHTIASFIKPQPDTIAAIFLLRKFGEAQFPGVSTATFEFWSTLPGGESSESLEAKGFLLVDLGHGRFDHHTSITDKKATMCASEIVAETLGVQNDPALRKLLAYAKRDDLEGKGTISSDPLDRAFGLSGLLTNLNKAYSHDLSGVVAMVLAIFEAHYFEEENRTKVMPAEWKQLTESGQAQQWTLQTKQGPLRVVQVPTDNAGMAGFLKAYHHFDLVAIRNSTGHVNIITSQAKQIDLSQVIATIRETELRKMGIDAVTVSPLNQPGRHSDVPHWYYDTMANTLQNGGLNPGSTPPTQLSNEEISQALRSGL